MLAAAIAAVFAIAGCSGDDSSTSSPSAGSESPTSGSTDSTVPADATIPPEPRPETIDELLDLGRPIVLAHTGGEDAYPGSTLYGFGESVAAGADMLDLNVLLTADGVLVVQHDDTVDRTTEGTGAVAELTFVEVHALDNAYNFSEACGACDDQPESDYVFRGVRTGEVASPDGYSADDFAIPSFEQLVERFPDLPLNIEIKGTGAAAMAAADELARLLTALGRAEASVVTSFEDDVVAYFHTLLPDVEVSPGVDLITAWVLGRTPLPDGMRILQLPPKFDGLTVITPELVADSTAAGYPIWVWPNDRSLENEASYRDFLDMGVLGLNINFPVEAVAAVLAHVGSTETGETAASSVEAMASEGCDRGTVQPEANSVVAFDAAGAAGTLLQHTPPSYDGTTPLPLIVDLHGWGEPVEIHVAFTDFVSVADDRGLVIITPTIDRPVDIWLATPGSPDVVWFDAMLDDIEARLCIDTARVFVTGMSNGAMMTSALACSLSHRVAAVAPVAGARDPRGCSPDRPVPMVSFHGTDDQFLSYDGGYGPEVADLPHPSGNGTLGDRPLSTEDSPDPAPDVLAAWAERNGCDDAAFQTFIGEDVELTTWSCPTDGETLLYTVVDGGHTWPGSKVSAMAENLIGRTTTTISATELIVEFFLRHPLRG